MSRQHRLVRALIEGLDRAESTDGYVTGHTLRYHCTLSALTAYGPESTAAAQHAQGLVAAVVGAYDALGFPLRRTARGEALYERQGLVAAAQVHAQTGVSSRLV